MGSAAFSFLAATVPGFNTTDRDWNKTALQTARAEGARDEGPPPGQRRSPAGGEVCKCCCTCSKQRLLGVSAR